jgi:hypothetical protein
MNLSIVLQPEQKISHTICIAGSVISYPRMHPTATFFSIQYQNNLTATEEVFFQTDDLPREFPMQTVKV